MAIFFKAKTVSPAISSALQDALKADPKQISNLEQEAANLATIVVQQVSGPGPLNWGRLGFTTLFLLVILAAGIYADLHNLEAWSKMLLHSFQILLGIAVGLLGGEAATKG